MTILPIPPIPWAEHPRPLLHLEPETDRDHDRLEKMLVDGWCCEHGRDPATGQLAWVDVAVDLVGVVA